MFALLITTDEKITPLHSKQGASERLQQLLFLISVPHSYMCKLLKAFAACKHMLKAHVYGDSRAIDY